MSEKVPEQGFVIAIRNSLPKEKNLSYGKPVAGKYIYEIDGVDVETVILSCLSKFYSLAVIASSTEDAIEKMLYSLSALSGDKRKFFLRQISNNIVRVANYTHQVAYGVDDKIKGHIRNDKLDLIESYENMLPKEENLFIKK